ncbi:Transcriptional regulator KdgR [bioreactor metagenome]|uniref:Transcriptional regulator KdgR n=1 Tax=bioreactor metagenome TaxID=1076179 RepID=A0A644YCK4_9ZZZZ|nr:IclR family transcriptional regulator [Christensenella sp.]
MEGSSGSHVQVLDRALDLIELLATSENGMSLAEMSAATNLPKSTIHRILASYASRHYIEKDPDTSTYFLGHKFVEIASLYLNKIVLKTEAAPIMHQMASMFGAISYLGVLENTEVVYLERAEQFNSLRLYTQIGKREPLYCTALGKILMAALPEPEFVHIAKQLSYEPYTPNSVRSFEAFKNEVRFAREHGYALDVEEHTVGSSCLAVPIYDYSRKVMAAMSISGRGLFDNFAVDYIYEQMKQASMELSKRMGYTQDPGARQS